LPSWNIRSFHPNQNESFHHRQVIFDINMNGHFMALLQVYLLPCFQVPKVIAVPEYFCGFLYIILYTYYYTKSGENSDRGKDTASFWHKNMVRNME